MDRPPFVIPSKTGPIDNETGYALDIPLGRQTWPGFHLDKPEVVARIKKLREDLGIEVSDDEFQPKGEAVNVRSIRKLKRTRKPKPGPKPAARRV